MIKDPQARISRKETWKEYFLFSLESPQLASQAQPGQFIMVRIGDQPYPLLRRPFSIHSKSKDRIEIFFKITGLGTSLLSQRGENDSLDIIGPLGKGFSTRGDFKGKEVILIGGGRGIAPPYFLAQTLQNKGAKVKIFYGGKTLEDLPLREKIERNGFRLFSSTDDGSFGFKGLVSDFFEQEVKKQNPYYVFACGPEAMMEKIARIVQAREIPAEFSLESIMGCGIGACWGCVRRIKREDEPEWLKVCQEGPVFSAEEIIWQEEEK